MLRKRPGFTAVAVFSLAVGIGLNSTVFSLINQTSLRELPVHEPQRVFTLTGRTGAGGERSSFAWPDRTDFLEQCHGFADVLAMRDESVVAHYRPIPHPLHAKVVSRNYFAFLGLRPALGYFFAETDSEALQDEPGVVISYSLWERDFGRDPDITGRTIQLDHRRLTVLGVAPKGFAGTNRWAPEDLWLPAQVYHADQPRLLALRNNPSFSLLARLRPGVTIEVAQSEAKVVTERLANAHPSDLRTRQARLSPLVRPKDARLYLAFVAHMLLPGAVLALACANVCALLIARAQTRTREIAARLALGGSRGRLVRQMLVESLLLSLLGGGAGLLLAVWTIRMLPAMLPPAMFRMLPDFYVDGRMLLFTAILSVVTTLFFGLLPAWQATRPELTPLLRGDSGSGLAGRRFTGLRRIVTGQLVVSLVLLCVAGLFLRSLLDSLGNHPSLRRSDLLLVELNPREYGIELPQIPAYFRRVREQIEALPGVQRVSVAATMPLEYASNWSRKASFPHGAALDATHAVSVRCNAVDEHLLDLMGWRLLRGRAFTPFDDVSSAAVVLVSQAAAQTFWPDRDAVGQVVRLGEAGGQVCQVIGVVADGPYNLNDGKSQPYFFQPVGQSRLYGTSTILVQTRVPPRSLFVPVREAVRAVDERVLPISIQTLHDSLRASQAMFGRQLFARFFMLFGVLGLLLAAIGLYAVAAYAVGRRTQEIGIRMAVGATRGAIAKLVLREGLRMALIGIALGVPLALGIAQLLRSGLHGFPPADPVTFIGVPLLLLVVALLASWLPARRAARIDPMAALRCE
jgi:predicted permease